MAWDARDFAVFGAMTAAVGIAYALAASRTGNTAYRGGAAVALAAAFVLVWVNGAVGIIGNESNDANVMFVGVLGVGLAGSVIARFRPQGMARTLYAMAAVQVLVAAIALVGKLGAAGPAWPRDLLFATVFFSAMWLVAARLFLGAARDKVLTGAQPGN